MEIDKTFWERLQSFVAKVQVHDAMSEEEREYILHVAAEQASGVQTIYCVLCGGKVQKGQKCKDKTCLSNKKYN
jgi:hypothetical protein